MYIDSAFSQADLQGLIDPSTVQESITSAVSSSRLGKSAQEEGVFQYHTPKQVPSVRW